MIQGRTLAFCLASAVFSQMSVAATISPDVVRWPNAQIPYAIDQGVSNEARTAWEEAVTHWDTNTNLTFIDISELNDAQQAAYPRTLRLTTNALTNIASLGYFDLASYVWSSVPGDRKPPFFDEPNNAITNPGQVDNDRMTASIKSSAGTQVAIHEIGHIAGLIHEQKRHDRDNHIFFHPSNLLPTVNAAEWGISPSSVTLGAYDYASALHYEPWQATNNPDSTDPTDWALSLEAPENATQQQIDLSNQLKNQVPNFESIFRNKSGLSTGDIQAINSFYAPGTADLRADFIEQVEFCNSTQFADGECESERELTLKTVIANLGPWESGNVTITHTLNPDYDLNDFDLSRVTTDAAQCAVDTISYCSNNTCAEIAPIDRAAQCDAGQLSNCMPHPALICQVSNLDPIELVTTQFTLTHPSGDGSHYSVFVTSNETDNDLAGNDSAFSDNFGDTPPPPSCGCTPCAQSTAENPDPVLPALALFAGFSMFRSRTAKKKG